MFTDRISLEKSIIVLIAISLLIRLHLIFVYEINWDEFLNLSMIYDYAHGNMREVLQTIFVHGFFWIDRFSVNEVDQIVTARIIIYVFGVATSGFLFLICRRFMPVHAALFVVLCYLSFSFVLRQGNSFRTDPIATFLLMATLWVIVCKPIQLRYALIAGGLTGLAGMITIKSIFYVPIFGIILLIKLYTTDNRRTVMHYGLAIVGISILSFLTFYALHRVTLTDPAPTLAFLERTTAKTLLEQDFRNALPTFRLALLQNPIFWLAAFLGIFVSARGLLRSKGSDTERWGLILSFSVILCSLLVYSESYAYYYPFMLAPVSILCGAGLEFFPERKRSRMTAITSIALGLMLFLHYFAALQMNNKAQHETIDVIHQAFPNSTPYIDRCSMVSSYPKQGFFMSVWGMINYYRDGIPIMHSIIEQHQPLFLIANREMLELDDLKPGEYGPRHFGLFEEDVDVLKNNYIRHWGAIYVAGKKLEFSNTKLSRTFEILIDGTYTVESADTIILNGRKIQPNDTINLTKGMHQLQLFEATGTVTLRWGNHLFRPHTPVPEGTLFNGF